METVLITGGTGLVGSALHPLLLARGFRVIILTRYPRSSNVPNLGYAHWNPEAQQADVDVIREADHIIHLAGANIAARRWTAAYKNEILQSRVCGTNLLFDILESETNKLRTFISASGISYYGSDPDSVFTEADPPSDDFLGETCRLWEQAALRFQQLGKRVAFIRTGMVLSLNEGVLPQVCRPLRLGVAAIPGRGDQWISWIHLRDLCRIYFSVISNAQWSGAINAVAPVPVTMKELVLSLAQILKGRNYVTLYIPKILLKLKLGEMSAEALKSSRVSPAKIERSEFRFSYPTLREALGALVIQG